MFCRIGVFAILAAFLALAETSQAQDPAAGRQKVSRRSKDAPPYAAAAATSQQLREESHDSFVRGLLPLSDHLEHLGLVYEAEARHAYDTLQRQTKGTYESNRATRFDQKQLERTFRPVYQARLTALEDVVQRLEAFQQPASTGWEADVALAKVALNRAQLETARLLGMKGAVIELTEAEERLAAEHYWKRLEDARVGQASLPALVQAVSLLNISPEFRRNMLQSVAEQTVIWEMEGAGIGRSDAVTRAQLDLSWLDGYKERRDGSIKVNDAAWRESDQLAATLFEQRAELYPKGTATLGDLSRTWHLRQQMHQIADEAHYEMPKASVEQHNRNLALLKEAAGATTDRRGRAAADVTFVALLGDLKAAELARK